MDAAFMNGAKGISIFTVGGLRSPEIRAKFKTYADSARASRAAMKGKPEEPVTGTANPDPFKNKGIMEATEFRMLAYLSFAKALALPEVKKADPAVLERFEVSSMQVSNPEDYISRLSEPRRRDPELQPVAKAIADQFVRDRKSITLRLDDYNLVKEYGATKFYQVTEQNSMVVFNVTFYLYGGILSGWNVEPDNESYKRYISGKIR